MTTLFINISCLVNVREEQYLLRGQDLASLPCIENAFLLVEDEQIAAYGHMYELELTLPVQPLVTVDMQGCMILPAWCDSHTHIVFAGSRETEFVDKINGLSYAEIAEIMKTTVSAVYSLLQRARQNLKMSVSATINKIS